MSLWCWQSVNSLITSSICNISKSRFLRVDPTERHRKTTLETGSSVIRSGGSFPFVTSTLCSPQLQSTWHYIVNLYVKIWHVRLEGANNMRHLSGGGGSTFGTVNFYIQNLLWLKSNRTPSVLSHVASGLNNGLNNFVNALEEKILAKICPHRFANFANFDRLLQNTHPPTKFYLPLLCNYVMWRVLCVT